MSVDQLVETRWKRFGNDRIYVKTFDGTDVGYVDLVKRSITVLSADHGPALQDCLRRWITPETEPSAPVVGSVDASGYPPPIVGPAVPTLVPIAPAVTRPVRDFAGNAAGAAARAKRDEINDQAPVRNLFARVLGVKTDERAWRIGAKGEEKVAKELGHLGPQWHVLHAVEVGDRGTDIDHVLIGPAGVFTMNTKRRPDGKAWVADRMIMVNRQKTDYLRNARFEGQRASRRLTSACGQAVHVTPVIVFVDLTEFDVKHMPPDVHVTTLRRMSGWLDSLVPVMDQAAADAIFAVARLSSTWTEGKR